MTDEAGRASHEHSECYRGPHGRVFSLRRSVNHTEQLPGSTRLCASVSAPVPARWELVVSLDLRVVAGPLQEVSHDIRCTVDAVLSALNLIDVKAVTVIAVFGCRLAIRYAPSGDPPDVLTVLQLLGDDLHL